jgi:hypothetical protein
MHVLPNGVGNLALRTNRLKKHACLGHHFSNSKQASQPRFYKLHRIPIILSLPLIYVFHLRKSCCIVLQPLLSICGFSLHRQLGPHVWQTDPACGIELGEVELAINVESMVSTKVMYCRADNHRHDL